MGEVIRAMDGIVTFNGAAIPFKTIRENETHKSVEVTNNSTVGGGVQRKTLRFTKEVEISGTLLKAGVEQVGKDLGFTFNATAYPTTDLSYEETFETSDKTSGSTTGSFTEHNLHRADRKFSASIWKEAAVAMPARGTEAAGTLLFAAGVSAAGTMTIESMNSDGEIKGDVKLSLNGYINGAVTEVSLGEAAGGSGTFVVTYADGVTTDNNLSGTALFVSKKLTTNIDGAVEFTYKFLLSGAIAEGIKS